MATIINNSAVTLTSDVLAPNPYIIVRDPTKDKALSGAKLYFGLPGTDPTDAANQKNVFLLQENGSALAISQPVVTGAGGIPLYNGSPAALAVDGAYSLRIDDSLNTQVYYLPKVTTPNLLGYSGIVIEEAKTYTSNPTLTYDVIEASSATFYASTTAAASPFKGELLRKDVDYSVGSSTQITLLGTYASGTVILGRSMDPTGEVINVTGNVKNVIAADTVAIAKTLDLDIGETITLNGKNALGDGLGGETYIVVVGGSGFADDENFINMDNGFQLKLIENNKRLKKYVQVTGAATINGGELTLNAQLGMDQTITLNQNVSNVVFTNINTASNTNTTFTVKVKQDPSTVYNITWPASIKWPSGTAPTVTPTVNKVDIYGFTSYDKGVSWYGFVMGQDYAS